MKKIISFIITILILTACDKYLDQQPLDLPTTAKDIFSKKVTTEQALYSCYSYTPKFWMLSASEDGGPWDTASDFVVVSSPHQVDNMKNGSWNPTAVPYKQWRRMYQGIRDCNFFLNHVDMCPETEIPAMLITQYKAEARFMRAFMYLYLIRLYGPVTLVHDEEIDPNDAYSAGRNTFDECVDYVANEFLEAAKDLPPVHQTNWYGKATSGAALGYRSQLLLFAASPLFNTDHSIYADWKSKQGAKVNLMPTTYNKEKWKTAAEAAKMVFDLPNTNYALVKKYKAAPSTEIDPYNSIYSAFRDSWNSELIWGRWGADGAFVQRLCPAAFTNGWGLFAPTQQLIDRFAMNNGKYPVVGYEDDMAGRGAGLIPIVDPASGYVENGTQMFFHPWDLQSRKTYNMYVNREPRFYLNISFNGMRMPMNVPATGYNGNNSQAVFNILNYSNGGNSQLGTNGPPTGYGSRKMLFRDNNIPPAGKGGSITYSIPVIPMMRLAEVYLNYVEALIEYGDMKDLGNTSSDLYKYWNMIRERAGVPDIQTVYPEAVGNQDILRKYIRLERDIELCFEQSRYFDVRRWAIAEKTLAGPFYGMDITQKDGSTSNNGEIGDATAGFWKRVKQTAKTDGTFLKKHYLYPLEQRELDRNRAIEQSPWW